MDMLLACLMVPFGVATVVLVRNISLSFAARGWEAVQATVVEVGSEERSDSDFRLGYHLLICYTYTMNNMTFEGNNYTFGKRIYSLREMNRLLHSYSPGQQIDIRVNPLPPQQSVIHAGPELVDFIFLAFALFAVVILLRSLM